MKIYKWIIISIILFANHSLTANGNDSISIAKVNYEIVSKKQPLQLRILVEFKIEEGRYSNISNKKTENKDSFSNFLKKEFLKSISEKAKIDFKIPDYINQIINMIQTDSLKSKARRIYESENISKSSLDVVSTNVSIENGVMFYKIKVVLNYFIIFEREVEIQLPEVSFYYNDTLIKTESKLIKIE